MRPQLTEAQRAALRWLRQHNGDGCFDSNGVLLAAGELAPVMRTTWNKLVAVGLCEFYGPGGKPRARLRLIGGPAA